MEKFDYIICGTGCSGLLLAHTICRSAILAEKKVLLIDNRTNPCQGHTFGFWVKEENEFDSIVLSQWKKILVANQSSSIPIILDEYRYCMIKGTDLYQTIKNELTGNPNFFFIHDTVKSINEYNNGTIVVTNTNIYQGNYTFNSTPPDYKKLSNHRDYITLWQHFKAWEITIPDESFDTTMATFMDFRIEQGANTRFAYVLPIASNKAFVEIIAFDKNINDTSSFDGLLKDYIANILKIHNYKINYTETGMIPMSEYSFNRTEDTYIINIGLRGGMVSSATGYGFTRMQRELKYIVTDLEKWGKPVVGNKIWSRRFNLYNNTLLDVLSKKRLKGNELFLDFFRKNNPDKILQFLDASTALNEELSIFSKVHISSFIKAIISTLIRSLKRKLKSALRMKQTTNFVSMTDETGPSKAVNFSAAKAV